MLGVLTIVLWFLPFIQVLAFVLAPATLVYSGIRIHRAIRTGVGGGAAAWGLVLGVVGLTLAVLLAVAFAQG
jgi:hypothetical protein